MSRENEFSFYFPITMKFPEEYKNTVCCIKCRKLGIEYTGKNHFRYCKECNSHVYIYNEIPIQKDPESAKKLV